jgi:hypothetical protein
MIESVLTFTLHAVSNTGQGKIDVYQTVFLQGQTATATIALSAFTNALDNGRMGIAIAIITKAGIVTGSGKTDTLPLDPRDVLCNQIRIPKCSFITFRMGLEMAEAVAVASVFVEGAPIKMSTRSDAAWVVEKSSGRVSGFHRVSLPAGVKLPSDALVSRRIRECAAVASGVDVAVVGSCTRFATAEDNRGGPRYRSVIGTRTTGEGSTRQGTNKARLSARKRFND